MIASSDSEPRRPATQAAARASQASLLLGFLAMASFVLVFLRLIASWHVSPRPAHDVSVLGQRLSYPAANAGAVVVLCLALLGAIVTARALVAIGRELSASRRLSRRLAELRATPRDGVFVIDDEGPEAFCAGLFRPRVYITSGVLRRLDEPARRAVLEHERHHAERRDPLRLATSRVIARSLFFLPGVRSLRRGQVLLSEMGADESAIHSTPEGRSALARAMLSFTEAAGPASVSSIDPARVDHLLGDGPSWRFPALLCAAAVLLLALLVGVALLVGREASGSTTLAPPFLSAQPCIVMLSLIPCGIALAAAWVGRVQREQAPAATRRG